MSYYPTESALSGANFLSFRSRNADSRRNLGLEHQLQCDTPAPASSTLGAAVVKDPRDIYMQKGKARSNLRHRTLIDYVRSSIAMVKVLVLELMGIVRSLLLFRTSKLHVCL